MSYPYLSVNPCCTDVVLNSPCGCTSTITNSGCGSNDPCSTHTVLSSNVIYNGPILPCIIAEPCDTLNVILQKIDQIICTLLGQITTLQTQVNNINAELLIINNQITNINNTLDVCCVITTTTSTTRNRCESFSLDNTGEDPVAITITDCITGVPSAILLLPGDTNICVITDSPLTVPGTVIATPFGPCGTTTTTSTSSSTTTSTTTVYYPCECLTAFNGDSVSHTVSYTDCFGVVLENEIDIPPYSTIKFCGCCAYSNSGLVTISIGENCIDQICPTTTTTTTCNHPNLVTNGTFDTSIAGWDVNIIPDWQWSFFNGGSVHYVGRDENAIISQNVLTPGVTYDITFDLWCDNPTNIINVFAGTTEYTVTGISAYTQVNLILTCVGTSLFGFQGIDSLAEPFDTIYIDNVNVSVHCSQFTTTTTTTAL